MEGAVAVALATESEGSMVTDESSVEEGINAGSVRGR